MDSEVPKNIMRKTLFVLLLVVSAFVLASCEKDKGVDITIPPSEEEETLPEGLYGDLLAIWNLHDNAGWENAMDQFVDANHLSLVNDSVRGRYDILTYGYVSFRSICMLRTYSYSDTLYHLMYWIFSPNLGWLQEMTVRYEQDIYNRHSQDYFCTFKWYNEENGIVNGDDCPDHETFVSLANEHAGDKWYYVLSCARYITFYPFADQDMLRLHVGGTQYYLQNFLGVQNRTDITHHLDFEFETHRDPYLWQ